MNRLSLCLAAALAFVPSMSVAQCGGGADCAVGRIGTGGQNSDGKAQGFRFQGQEGGAAITNAGNPDAGRLTINSDDDGSLSGTFRSGIVRGKTTGFFGDCTGLCGDLSDDPDEP